MENQRIPNKDDAHELALDFDKYWEVAKFAKRLGLRAVATDVLNEGDAALNIYADALVEPEHKQRAESEAPLHIRARTFEQARAIRRPLSDEFVADILNDNLSVGGMKVYDVKLCLDNTPLDASDRLTVEHPEGIAELYQSEIAMIEAILTVGAGGSEADEQQKRQLLTRISAAGKSAIDLIPNHRNGGVTKGISEVLRWGLPDQSRLGDYGKSRPNVAVQDQFFAVAIKAYSKKRVEEKIDGNAPKLTKRIYLNPKIVDAPAIYAELLNTIDKAGLSAQIKMWGRENELMRRASSGDTTGYLRGDGIVVYAQDSTADEILAIVLDIATRHASSFVGRGLNRTPQRIADGIGVGDEPLKKGTSLTAHRAAFLREVANKTREAGLTGVEAVEYFKRLLNKAGPINGIRPDNIAFNA